MNQFTWIGIVLILLGIAFVLVSILGRFFTFEGIPNWLIFVYSSDNFYFATSPILILISMIVLIFKCLTN
ncbi:hypothetical protein AKJ57_04720 [candidate division MSBL1 archaeon SCGC-AAA259A05]|uniref:DUF2905 domain-containing protein n=1 Tax=candidate division MSBL1 archaeon SCGC-AAA259A05 TaxID=1698259 RepID=A0A133U6W6_9EURY|nr:hypothetical protein AKJ57_04720 [candidate division MSBL1 archaeon SCGC-AAA259A05]